MAVGKRTGNIVWLAGPSPGSCHDIVMLRRFGLANHLCAGELVLGDKGYQGHTSVVVPYRGHGYPYYHNNCLMCDFNVILSKNRIVVERAFGRIKVFRCFSTQWRHALALHPIAFAFIAKVCNIANEYNPLFAL